MIELCCEYLSVRCIWLYVLVTSRMRFRVNPHFIVALPECQETPCSKQARNLKFKWLQLDLTPQPLSSKTNTQPFNQTGQMVELCCEYLSVRCIWLHVLVMSRTRFTVNPHFIIALPECQETPCSKQARNLKFKWLQLDSTPQPLSL